MPIDNVLATHARKREWLIATGLKRSSAGFNKVFPGRMRQDYINIEGFDHTSFYYMSSCREYVCLTEPYHNVGEALNAVLLESEKYRFGFSFQIGSMRQGIWNPGHCRPLLLAKKETNLDLKQLIAALPWIEK